MPTIDRKNIEIHPSWFKHLSDEFEKDYMYALREFLRSEYQRGKQIFPRGKEYFAAFNLTPFEDVKVVILGQDPYHGLGQAHGLCFSVRHGTDLPPSLMNIFKELKTDLGFSPNQSGCLERWAKQGVLLLNSVLTVEQGKAASHQGRGWETFTDEVIRKLNDERKNIVFILWGSYAQKKGAFVDRKKHFVIESPHPSPLSAHRGFFGSKPFSQTNAYLKSKGLDPIDWSL
jgi:uracil-DNA glycosylase